MAMKLRDFTPHKLVIPLLLSQSVEAGGVISVLSEAFGPVDFVSKALSFDFTTYYQAEMGENLRRIFISFADCVDPTALPDIKLKTDILERQLSIPRPNAGAIGAETSAGDDVARGPRVDRRVNLDPGVLSLSSLILASTKDFAHRIPLRNGIYAEVTLLYTGGRFQPLPWTFPDYRSPAYHQILKDVRDIYHEQLRRREQR